MVGISGNWFIWGRGLCYKWELISPFSPKREGYGLPAESQGCVQYSLRAVINWLGLFSGSFSVFTWFFCICESQPLQLGQDTGSGFSLWAPLFRLVELNSVIFSLNVSSPPHLPRLWILRMLERRQASPPLYSTWCIHYQILKHSYKKNLVELLLQFKSKTSQMKHYSAGETWGFVVVS